MTIEEIQQKIISEFSCFDDWMDRYNHLIDMGKITSSAAASRGSGFMPP